MEKSPFGKLSPELRNIYHFALHERRLVAISRHYNPEPALLRTCKQIREEAELLFYAINDFATISDFAKWEHVQHWLRHGPQQKLGLIRSLTVRIEVPGFTVPEETLNATSTHTAGEGWLQPADLPIIRTFADVSFGGRPIESVLQMVVNGAMDDVAYKKAKLLPKTIFQWHMFAQFMMLYVAYGRTCFRDAVKGDSTSTLSVAGLRALEERLQEGMRRRL